MKTIENTGLQDDLTTENKERRLENKVALQEQKIEELEAKIRFYEEYFRLNQHQKYGASSEKIPPEQVSFFNEAEKLSAQPPEEPCVDELVEKRRKAARRLGRLIMIFPSKRNTTRCPKMKRPVRPAITLCMK